MVLFCIGCSSQKNLGPKQTGDWAYAPHTVAVHALSRFKNPNDDETTLIVHVEFADGDDFACRAVGELSVTITDSQGAVLGTQVVHLEDPSENYLRFDPVTRTYIVLFNNIAEKRNLINARATFTSASEKPIRSPKLAIKNNRKNKSQK